MLFLFDSNEQDLANCRVFDGFWLARHATGTLGLLTAALAGTCGHHIADDWRAADGFALHLAALAAAMASRSRLIPG